MPVAQQAELALTIGAHGDSGPEFADIECQVL